MTEDRDLNEWSAEIREEVFRLVEESERRKGVCSHSAAEAVRFTAWIAHCLGLGAVHTDRMADAIRRHEIECPHCGRPEVR